MKMDYDLLRQILLFIESQDDIDIYSNTIKIDNYEYKEIYYHLLLLLDANFIDISAHIPTCGTLYEDLVINRITFQGHEYLNSIRNDNIWSKTKSKFSHMANCVTLEIIQTIATSLIKLKLGIP